MRRKVPAARWALIGEVGRLVGHGADTSARGGRIVSSTALVI